MSWLTEPDDWDTDEREPDEPKSRLRLIALILGGWLVVGIVVLVVLLAVGGGKKDGTAEPGPSASAVSASPSASPTDALPAGWVQQATDDQTNCAAHSYGQVKAFFTKTPCSSVHRTLATTNQGGRTVIVSSYAVTFDTAAQAAQYLKLVATDGTGDVNDLLREGITYPGAPSALPDFAFASAARGTKVAVSEAGYVSGASSSDDAVLKKVAAAGVAAS